MISALFIDLDGTLIRTKSRKKFPVDKFDWEFIPRTLEVVKEAKNLGKTLVIVTNQGGIGIGRLDEADFLEKMDAICNSIHELTGYVLNEDFRYYYCPSNEAQHFDRKPNPGMAYQAALDMGISLRHSVMIGDASGKKDDWSASDLNFSINAGIGKYIDVDSYLKSGFFDPRQMLSFFVKRTFKSWKEREEDKEFFKDINGD